MASRPFQQLHHRFSKLEDGGDDLRIERVMETAGRAFHDSLTQGLIALKSQPKWMRNLPQIPVTYEDRKGKVVSEEVVPWATYWWHSVLWLAKNQPGSGITLPGRRVSWLEDDQWRHFDELAEATLSPRASDKSRRRMWSGIASASADACDFLSRCQETNFANVPQSGGPTEPTRPVPLSYAAKQWFGRDPRTLRKAIDAGSITARKESARLWVFELHEVNEHKPSAKSDADPLKSNPNQPRQTDTDKPAKKP